MKQIALMGAPFSPAQIAQLRTEAQEAGYELLELEPKGHYPHTALQDAEILVGYFPRRLLQNAKSLRWLQLPSAGADRYVDPSLYAHEAFLLTNSSGAFGAAIGEQLLMGTLMLLRRMPEYARQQREKVWQRVGDLRFLRGAQVTILGTGNLGSTFGGYCTALGATVRGVSRSGRAVPGFARVYPVSQIQAAVAGSQVVAACLPLTRETQGLVDENVFSAMEPGAIFLNVGRGKTVVEAALVSALQSGHLSGAMIDVAQQEPMPQDCPLWEMDQVIVTPHVSGSDLDPQNGALIFGIFMDNFHRYLSGEPLQNVVDRNLGY